MVDLGHMEICKRILFKILGDVCFVGLEGMNMFIILVMCLVHVTSDLYGFSVRLLNKLYLFHEIGRTNSKF